MEEFKKNSYLQGRTHLKNLSKVIQDDKKLKKMFDQRNNAEGTSGDDKIKTKEKKLTNGLNSSQIGGRLFATQVSSYLSSTNGQTCPSSDFFTACGSQSTRINDTSQPEFRDSRNISKSKVDTTQTQSDNLVLKWPNYKDTLELHKPQKFE